MNKEEQQETRAATVISGKEIPVISKVGISDAQPFTPQKIQITATPKSSNNPTNAIIGKKVKEETSVQRGDSSGAPFVPKILPLRKMKAKSHSLPPEARVVQEKSVTPSRSRFKPKSNDEIKVEPMEIVPALKKHRHDLSAEELERRQNQRSKQVLKELKRQKKQQKRQMITERRRKEAITKLQDEIRTKNTARHRRNSIEMEKTCADDRIPRVKAELPVAPQRRKPAVPRLSGRRSEKKTTTTPASTGFEIQNEVRPASRIKIPVPRQTTRPKPSVKSENEEPVNIENQAEVEKRRTEARVFMEKKKKQRARQMQQKKTSMLKAETRRKERLEKLESSRQEQLQAQQSLLYQAKPKRSTTEKTSDEPQVLVSEQLLIAGFLDANNDGALSDFLSPKSAVDDADFETTSVEKQITEVEDVPIQENAKEEFVVVESVQIEEKIEIALSEKAADEVFFESSDDDEIVEESENMERLEKLQSLQRLMEDLSSRIVNLTQPQPVKVVEEAIQTDFESLTARITKPEAVSTMEETEIEIQKEMEILAKAIQPPVVESSSFDLEAKPVHVVDLSTENMEASEIKAVDSIFSSMNEPIGASYIHITKPRESSAERSSPKKPASPPKRSSPSRARSKSPTRKAPPSPPKADARNRSRSPVRRKEIESKRSPAKKQVDKLDELVSAADDSMRVVDIMAQQVMQRQQKLAAAVVEPPSPEPVVESVDVFQESLSLVTDALDFPTATVEPITLPSPTKSSDIEEYESEKMPEILEPVPTQTDVKVETKKPPRVRIEREIPRSEAADVRRRLSPASLSRQLIAEVEYQESIYETQLQLSAIERESMVSQAQEETIQIAQSWYADATASADAEAHRLQDVAAANEWQDQMTQLTEKLEQNFTDKLESMIKKQTSLQTELQQAQQRENSVQTDEARTSSVAVEAIILPEESAEDTNKVILENDETPKEEIEAPENESESKVKVDEFESHDSVIEIEKESYPVTQSLTKGSSEEEFESDYSEEIEEESHEAMESPMLSVNERTEEPSDKNDEFESDYSSHDEDIQEVSDSIHLEQEQSIRSVERVKAQESQEISGYSSFESEEPSIVDEQEVVKEESSPVVEIESEGEAPNSSFESDKLPSNLVEQEELMPDPAVEIESEEEASIEEDSDYSSFEEEVESDDEVTELSTKAEILQPIEALKAESVEGSIEEKPASEYSSEDEDIERSIEQDILKASVSRQAINSIDEESAKPTESVSKSHEESYSDESFETLETTEYKDDSFEATASASADDTHLNQLKVKLAERKQEMNRLKRENKKRQIQEEESEVLAEIEAIERVILAEQDRLNDMNHPPAKPIEFEFEKGSPDAIFSEFNETAVVSGHEQQVLASEFDPTAEIAAAPVETFSVVSMPIEQDVDITGYESSSSTDLSFDGNEVESLSIDDDSFASEDSAASEDTTQETIKIPQASILLVEDSPLQDDSALLQEFKSEVKESIAGEREESVAALVGSNEKIVAEPTTKEESDKEDVFSDIEEEIIEQEESITAAQNIVQLEDDSRIINDEKTKEELKREDVFSDIEEEFMDQDESIAAPEQTQLENERLDLKELKREDVFSDIEEEFMDQETKKEDIFSDIEVDQDEGSASAQEELVLSEEELGDSTPNRIKRRQELVETITNLLMEDVTSEISTVIHQEVERREKLNRNPPELLEKWLERAQDQKFVDWSLEIRSYVTSIITSSASTLTDQVLESPSSNRILPLELYVEFEERDDSTDEALHIHHKAMFDTIEDILQQARSKKPLHWRTYAHGGGKLPVQDILDYVLKTMDRQGIFKKPETAQVTWFDLIKEKTNAAKLAADLALDNARRVACDDHRERVDSHSENLHNRMSESILEELMLDTAIEMDRLLK